MQNQSSSKQLDRAFDEYMEVVFAVADARRNDCVVPYCQKNDLSFLAGNGEYYFIKRGGKHIPIDDLPKHVRDVVDMEVPGLRTNSLGTLMTNYINPNLEEA